ncbi:hypothetical protein F383_31983 [Gossypium arboreum]|uniref:Uncharacterized protein n=1 Tax=Gossypium arboreum TaxID=29729 RepID=A0A0B0PMK7_GOSAR|nr:hypothetical protein F383_31983 [Gossypium arboreum]
MLYIEVFKYCKLKC